MVRCEDSRHELMGKLGSPLRPPTQRSSPSGGLHLLWLLSDADHAVDKSTLVTETGDTGEERPERRVTKELSVAPCLACRDAIADEPAGKLVPALGGLLLMMRRRGADVDEGEGRP